VPLAWSLTCSISRQGHWSGCPGRPKVDVLLASREDVFGDYTAEGFEAAVVARFDVRSRTPIPGSPRVLYHLVRRRADD